MCLALISNLTFPLWFHVTSAALYKSAGAARIKNTYLPTYPPTCELPSYLPAHLYLLPGVPLHTDTNPPPPKHTDTHTRLLLVPRVSSDIRVFPRVNFCYLYHESAQPTCCKKLNNGANLPNMTKLGPLSVFIDSSTLSLPLPLPLPPSFLSLSLFPSSSLPLSRT